MDSSYSDYLKQEYQQFLELIKKNIDLEQWGFVQNYSSVIERDTFPFIVIYDSQQCRVKFEYDAVDFGAVQHNYREVRIWYSRVHPKNYFYRKSIRYEHSIYYYVLNFLDGLSPQEVVEGKGQDPRVIHEFERTGASWVLSNEYQIGEVASVIKTLRLHNRIWEYYGKRFFDLFDLKNSELWEKYVQFHNEIKRLHYEIWREREKAGKPFKQFDDFVPDELI